MLPASAGFGCLAPMGGHWGQKGVNIKILQKKGCVVPLIQSIEIVCFGVDKKEYSVLLSQYLL